MTYIRLIRRSPRYEGGEDIIYCFEIYKSRLLFQAFFILLHLRSLQCEFHKQVGIDYAFNLKHPESCRDRTTPAVSNRAHTNARVPNGVTDYEIYLRADENAGAGPGKLGPQISVILSKCLASP